MGTPWLLPSRCRAVVLAVVLAASLGAYAAVESRQGPTGRPWSRVVAVGDSVPFGEACGCEPFPGLLADALAARERGTVDVSSLSFDGATSDTALAAEDLTGLGPAVGRVTVVTVGANDLDDSRADDPACADLRCWDGALARVDGNVRAIVKDATGAGRRTRVVVTGYWSVFLDGSLARGRGPVYVANTDALTRRLNAVLARAARDGGARYADLYGPFKGPRGTRDDTELLAGDGDHPNSAGHELIARAVDRALNS